MTRRKPQDIAISRTLVLFPALFLTLFLSALKTNADETITEGVLKNIPYSGIYEKVVPLHDGLYEGEAFVEGGASRPRVLFIEGLIASGDMNGDGVDEKAVLLAENSGGSGESIFLAIVGTREGKAQNLATVYIGDRTKIRSLKIESAHVILQVVAVGDGEPMCCGTAKRQLSYTLANHSLALASAMELGNFSLADLTSDTWHLLEFSRDQPVPTEVRITAVFSEDKINGASGCNRYSASIKRSLPHQFAITQAATTRKMCPPLLIEAETRYLFLLSRATGFGFHAGDLVLSFRDGDNFGQLRFTNRDPD